MVSVVLGSYNRLAFLKLAIQSVQNQENSPVAEIIVVDGGSSDGSVEWLLSQNHIITIIQHNRGEWLGKPIVRRSWGYFMNLAFKCSSSKYVCMISDDTLLHQTALDEAYRQFEKELKNGRKLGGLAFYWRDSVDAVDYHIGAPAGGLVYVNHGLYLNKALSEVDYIDEEKFKFYCADIDLCLKLWAAGYEVMPAVNSYAEHYPYATLNVRHGNQKIAQQDFLQIVEKWRQRYPHLTNRNLGDVHKKSYKDPFHTAKIYESIFQECKKQNRIYFVKKVLLGYWNDFYGSYRFWSRRLMRWFLK